MDSRSAVDPKGSTNPTTKGTPSTEPTASPTRAASMFSNATHTRIKDSSFVINTTNVNPGAGSSLDVLYKRVAPNAILNAGGRADEVRCHPGTREEVIGRIEKWRDAQDDATASIFWLSGPFGAGKSAIVQTIAERCNDQGLPQANFFFFRADSTRNTVSPLVATLLHQVIPLYPSLRETVATVISTDPLIFDTILEEQLAQLVVAPLRAVQQSSVAYRPLVLLIDGLDECDSQDSQRRILRAFGKFLAELHCPFRLFVGSRDESQIKTAFNQLPAPVFSLYLNDEYSPERDIRRFVTAEFQKVKETHPLTHTLHDDWPSNEDIEGIVQKSSGQFIYAATVMRFILHSSASPELSLERVQGVAQVATGSPFSQLDAIYAFILSRADDQQALKDMLHTHFLIQNMISFTGHSEPSIKRDWTLALPQTFSVYNHRYTDSVIRSCTADLAAIARLGTDGLIFYHASLRDYFDDSSRSREYFLDMDAFHVKIVPTLLEHATHHKQGVRLAQPCLMSLKTVTPDIMSALLQVKPKVLAGIIGNKRSMSKFLQNIHYLCIRHNDVANYKQLLHRYMAQYMSISDLNSALKVLHDVPCIQEHVAMAQIDLLRGDIAQDLNIVAVDALRPQSAFNAHEISLWIKDMLQRIHAEHYPQQLETYKRLIGQWIFWALLNDIALEDLHNLPYGRWYFWQGTVAKWITSYLVR